MLQPYYGATTRGDRIGVWSSPSLATLLVQPEQVVWRDTDPSRNTQMWAPAFRHVGSRWYIYYTASDGVDANHRMYVLESAGDDPLGPYTFKAKIADFGEYAIDGEPITVNGQQYFVWTGPGRGQGGPAQLYIVRMSDPWTSTGARVAIPADGGCTEVREGPTPLYGAARTFLTYSTCDTGKPDYQLWMTSIANGADPMVASNWVQNPGAIFSRNDETGVWGPGHHSFFKSPDGTEDWIAYHGKNTSTYTYDFRTTRVQKITWNADGTPNLGRPLAAGATQTLPSGDPRLVQLLDQRHRRHGRLHRQLELGFGLRQPMLLGQRPLEQRGRRHRHHPLHRHQGCASQRCRCRKRDRRHLDRRRPRTTHRLLQLHPRRRTTDVHQPYPRERRPHLDGPRHRRQEPGREQHRDQPGPHRGVLTQVRRTAHRHSQDLIERIQVRSV
ncbi:glycoside hydrolase family 43 protein [Kribbella sp. CWNU-51]